MRAPGTLLVTDASRGSALAIVRSLGRLGWRVVAADERPGSAGGRSRYAHAAWTYPSPETRGHDYVASLLEAVRVHEVDLVLPVTDAAALPLAQARLAGRARLLLPDDGARRVVQDKERTVELARRLGVPVPRTVVVRTTAEARAAGEEVGFPAVLKPATSACWRPLEGVVERFSVSYARDAEDLERRVAELEGRVSVLVQELRTGPGRGVELLTDRGRLVAAFQHRRLAEVPVTGGASAWRISEELDPALLEWSRRFAEALGWTGLVMVEFKGAPDPVLMEINGRVWGSLPLACKAGMDFPARLLDLVTRNGGVRGGASSGEDPVTAYEIGLRAYDPGRLVTWILSTLAGRRRHSFVPAPRRSAAFRGLLALLDPRQVSDVFDARDPLPALADAWRFARHLGRKLSPAARGPRQRVPRSPAALERG